MKKQIEQNGITFLIECDLTQSTRPRSNGDIFNTSPFPKKQPEFTHTVSVCSIKPNNAFNTERTCNTAELESTINELENEARKWAKEQTEGAEKSKEQKILEGLGFTE